MNAKATDGITPLHWAVKKDALKMIEGLVQNGADPYATTSNGTTVLSWIGNTKVRELLEQSQPMLRWSDPRQSVRLRCDCPRPLRPRRRE